MKLKIGNVELKNNIISANETMANSALRVLGCAIQNKVTLGEVKEDVSANRKRL